MSTTVKIIPRTGRCNDCKAYRERHGLYNIDGIIKSCALGYSQHQAFGRLTRPAEPCPRPLNDDQLFDAEQLTKAARLAKPA